MWSTVSSSLSTSSPHVPRPATALLTPPTHHSPQFGSPTNSSPSPPLQRQPFSPPLQLHPTAPAAIDSGGTNFAPRASLLDPKCPTPSPSVQSPTHHSPPLQLNSAPLVPPPYLSPSFSFPPHASEGPAQRDKAQHLLSTDPTPIICPPLQHNATSPPIQLNSSEPTPLFPPSLHSTSVSFPPHLSISSTAQIPSPTPSSSIQSLITPLSTPFLSPITSSSFSFPPNQLPLPAGVGINTQTHK